MCELVENKDFKVIPDQTPSSFRLLKSLALLLLFLHIVVPLASQTSQITLFTFIFLVQIGVPKNLHRLLKSLPFLWYKLGLS